MKPHVAPLLWIAIAAILASCSDKQTVQERAQKELTGIVTEEVRSETLQGATEVPGTVRSKVSTVIAARTGGQILRVNVSEGNAVQPGQLLVVVDGRDADAQAAGAQAVETEAIQTLDETDHVIRAGEAALQAATANRDLAAATLERYRTLREKRSISPQEFDEAQARHAAASAETSRASETLESLKSKRAQVLARIDQSQAHRRSAALHQEYTQVLAPAAGVVIKKHVEPGMVAAPGMPLLTIEDNSRYQLDLPVEESRLADARVGTQVRAHIDALGPEVLTLRVSEILPTTDPVTRTLTVRLDLPARSGLRSGLFGRAFLPTGSREAVTIPQSLVVRRGQLTGVWVLEDQTARYRLVTLGKAESTRVEVLSGLAVGERLISSPHDGLEDGQKARP